MISTTSQSFSAYKSSRVRPTFVRPTLVNDYRPRRVSSKVQARRRIAVALLVFTVLTAVLVPARAAFGGRSLVASERHTAVEDNVTSIVVQPGDTLWSIAKRLEPKSDPREIVHKLDNARNGAPLQAGETIKWSR